MKRLPDIVVEDGVENRIDAGIRVSEPEEERFQFAWNENAVRTASADDVDDEEPDPHPAEEGYDGRHPDRRAHLTLLTAHALAELRRRFRPALLSKRFPFLFDGHFTVSVRLSLAAAAAFHGCGTARQRIPTAIVRFQVYGKRTDSLSRAFGRSSSSTRFYDRRRQLGPVSSCPPFFGSESLSTTDTCFGS